MAGKDDDLGMSELDSGMPALDDVMRDMDGGKSKGGKDDDDLGFDLDLKPFDPFAKDDDSNADDRLENDPARKDGKKDEVVFEVADDEGDDSREEEEFKDTRKKGDPRKMSRLQREMKLKQEARDKLGVLGSHVDRIASEVTMAKRAEFHTRRALGEMALSTARKDIASYQRELERASEDGNREEIGRLTRAQAEAEAIVIKAEALIERYAHDKVEKFFFNPEIPEDVRDTGGGTSKGKDWIDANAAWFNNPDKYGAEIAYARAADAQLAREKKFDLNSDEYYQELTRRVALNMRSVEVYTNDGRLARVGERTRGGGSKVAQDTTGSSSGGGSHQSRRPDNGGKRETVTAEEQRFLGKMGIDFANPEHLKELKANRVR